MHQRVLQHLRRVARHIAPGSRLQSSGPQHQRASRTPHLLLAAAALGTAGGCSLLYDLSAEQCSTDGDCAFLGSDYQCNAAKVCQAPTIGGGNGGSSSGSDQGGGSGSSGDGGDSGAGASNGGASGNTSGGSGGSGEQPECTTNSQCIDDHGGQPWICRNNSCVEIVSDECPFVMAGDNLENLRSESPIIFGAYTYIFPGAPVTDSPSTANYAMAIEEFTSGAPGGGLDNGRRKMVAVGCNGIDPSTFDASLQHLIETVRAPAIIAPVPSADLVTMFTSRGEAAGTFFMSPIDADSTLTTLDDSGLVWNILGSAAGLVPPYQPLLTRAEELIKEQQSISTIRVALVDDDTDFMGDMSSLLTGGSNPIVFNGVSLSDNITNDNYLGRTIPANPGEQGADDIYLDTISDLLDFAPHIIIPVNNFAFVDEVMAGLEAAWDTEVGAQPHPFYLLSPYHASLPDIQELVTQSSGLQLNLRMMGVNFESALDTSVLDAYRIRFQAEFQGAYPANFENFYDAAWYVMYAFAAAPQVTQYRGEDVRIGMSRLVRMDAPEAFIYKVGGTAEPDSDVAEVLSAIRVRGELGIQLVGTMGPPDFDPVSGARKTRGSAYCVTVGGGFMFDVLRYNAVGPAMEGDPSGTCIPPGF